MNMQSPRPANRMPERFRWKKTPAVKQLGYPFRVSVCVAVLCDNRRRIVSVSDTKFSFDGNYSAEDIAVKAIEIHPRWSLLYAGNDVTSVPFVIAEATERLRKIDEPTPREAAAAVHDAHRSRLHQEIDS